MNRKGSGDENTSEIVLQLHIHVHVVHRYMYMFALILCSCDSSAAVISDMYGVDTLSCGLFLKLLFCMNTSAYAHMHPTHTHTCTHPQVHVHTHLHEVCFDSVLMLRHLVLCVRI